MLLCRVANLMVLSSKFINALTLQAVSSVHELGNQRQHDGFDVPLSGQIRFAGFKMSLWGHYVTMSLGEFVCLSERIHRYLIQAGRK
jgi:hypothetical protein